MPRRSGFFMKESIKIKGGYVPYKMSSDELQTYLRERSRGCGSHSSKKDYKRNPKHRQRY